MGKGTIKSNLGEGLYSVELEKDLDSITAEIALIDAKLTELLAKIAEIQTAIESEMGGDYNPDPDPDPDAEDEPPADDLPPGPASQNSVVS